jgi:hypothetical protein
VTQREPDNSPDPEGQRTERRLVWALCALAAVRVMVYSAIFPIFNNVDEPYHYDLVTQYSRGETPHAGMHLLPETAHTVVYYGTPEYIKTPDMYPDNKIRPPTWAMPAEQAADVLTTYEPMWTAQANYEEAQPPLYYMAAGAWLRAGRLLGMGEGFLPYWVRFWNVFPAMGIVWLGYAAARLILPGRPAVRLGVALLAAAMPQDAFYSVQNDVLTPVCFGLAFIGLSRILRPGVPGRGVAAMTGLALAATCLVKMSNLPLLAVGLAAAGFKAWQLAKTGDSAKAGPALMWLSVCAVAPMAGLLAWNLHAFGDLSGTTGKIAALGWTRKPFREWWGHPIFTLRGLHEFWSALMASFWRGEFVWGRVRVAWAVTDAIYWISSAVLVVLGVASLQSRSGDVMGWRRQALWLGFSSFAASVAFLGLLSTVYDFGKCVYPSAEFPYFASGRLVTGALIPFLLLYVRGLDWALGSGKSGRLTLGVLAAFALLITISEAVISLPALASQYNLIHWLTAGK